MVGRWSTSDQIGFGSGGVRRSEHGVSKVRHGMEGIDGLEVSLNALVDGPSRENAAEVITDMRRGAAEVMYSV